MLEAPSAVQPSAARLTRLTQPGRPPGASTPGASPLPGIAIALQPHRILALHDAPGARDHRGVAANEVGVGGIDLERLRAVRERVLLGEFGAEEEDLRRVVDPEDRDQD